MNAKQLTFPEHLQTQNRFHSLDAHHSYVQPICTNMQINVQFYCHKSRASFALITISAQEYVLNIYCNSVFINGTFFCATTYSYQSKIRSNVLFLGLP